MRAPHAVASPRPLTSHTPPVRDTQHHWHATSDLCAAAKRTARRAPEHHNIRRESRIMRHEAMWRCARHRLPRKPAIRDGAAPRSAETREESTWGQGTSLVRFGAAPPPRLSARQRRHGHRALLVSPRERECPRGSVQEISTAEPSRRPATAARREGARAFCPRAFCPHARAGARGTRRAPQPPKRRASCSAAPR